MLSTSVSVEGGAYGNTLSSSVDYKRVRQETNTNEFIYTVSGGSCSVYKAGLNPLKLPKLSDAFVDAVKGLPVEYNPDNYMKFIGIYGTHYFNKIKMGAKFNYVSKISKEGWSKLESDGVTVSAAASYSGKFDLGLKTSNTYEQEQAQKFNKQREEWSQVSIGSKPPADGKVSTWSQSCFNDPMPISYNLESIQHLFDEELLPNEKNLIEKNKNMNKALREYCSFLKSNGEVDSCQEPGEDRGLPIIENSCRLCAKNCGGAYSEQTGTISADKNWLNWSFTYDNKCEGSPENRDVDGGIKLCCQKENKTRSGSCKLCTSCGGSFGHYGGAVMFDSNWTNWIRAYDNNCHGDQRARKNPGDGIKFCCNQPICNICSSCGGEYPHETGVLSADKSWPDFFRGKSDACGGDLRLVSYNHGMKLCCKSR
jgi:hypothetical protein